MPGIEVGIELMLSPCSKEEEVPDVVPTSELWLELTTEDVWSLLCNKVELPVELGATLEDVVAALLPVSEADVWPGLPSALTELVANDVSEVPIGVLTPPSDISPDVLTNVDAVEELRDKPRFGADADVREEEVVLDSSLLVSTVLADSDSLVVWLDENTLWILLDDPADPCSTLCRFRLADVIVTAASSNPSIRL